jgi:hypothetical protein
VPPTPTLQLRVADESCHLAGSRSASSRPWPTMAGCARRPPPLLARSRRGASTAGQDSGRIDPAGAAAVKLWCGETACRRVVVRGHQLQRCGWGVAERLSRQLQRWSWSDGEERWANSAVEAGVGLWGFGVVDSNSNVGVGIAEGHSCFLTPTPSLELELGERSLIDG